MLAQSEILVIDRSDHSMCKKSREVPAFLLPRLFNSTLETIMSSPRTFDQVLVW